MSMAIMHNLWIQIKECVKYFIHLQMYRRNNTNEYSHNKFVALAIYRTFDKWICNIFKTVSNQTHQWIITVCREIIYIKCGARQK